MRVTVLLADSAQAVGDKLYVLGGGWSFTGPDIGPMALAILVGVDWHEANRRFALLVELLDEDGQPATVGEPDPEPVRFEGAVEVGRPAGHPEGTPINIPLAFNLLPLPLEPGRRYMWRVSLDGRTEETWQVAFNVRPQV